MKSLWIFKQCKFQVVLVIHDLSNVPYVSGLYHCRMKLKTTKYSTPKSTVKDHVVTWNSEFVFEVTIPVGRDGVLNSSELTLVIKQEINEGKSSEKIGSVVLNISEFAGERMVQKKLLLRDSNVNSILKITMDMKLLKGDPSFLVPNSTYSEDITDINRRNTKNDILPIEHLDELPSALENINKTDDFLIVNEIFANSSKSSTFKSNITHSTTK